MTRYAELFRSPTQQEKAHPKQAKNNAGGYAFQLDDFKRLERFLILGSDSGTYYASARKLTRENAHCVDRCLTADGVRTLHTISSISRAGRAPSNEPAIFALAMAAAHPNEAVRKEAMRVLPEVCRTGTHLFQFVETVKNFRGWGRALRRGISDWYLNKKDEKLAYQMAKYRNRSGWTHRDVMRVAHPETLDYGKQQLFRWVTKGTFEEGMPGIIEGYERAKTADANESINLISEFGLTHEMLRTEVLKDPGVWEALLQKMPLGALIRNLGRMSSIGTLSPLSDNTNLVIQRLGDDALLQKARIHPIKVLTALLIYKAGHGARGNLSWNADNRIVDALDGAFYKAFGHIEPTGKNIFLGLDVSGSMGSAWGSANLCGAPGLSARVASAAMAMTVARTEQNFFSMAFSHQLLNFPLSSRQRLDDVCTQMSGLPFGRTDCALPMLAAAEGKIPVDAFIIYTDNETWYGNVHPHRALEQYRQRMGRDAKLIVNGMTATEFSIANPDDPGMLDVVGFDTATPNIISNFITG